MIMQLGVSIVCSHGSEPFPKECPADSDDRRQSDGTAVSEMFAI